MVELIGVPPQVLFGQPLLGLINGSFYALLSLGLALIIEGLFRNCYGVSGQPYPIPAALAGGHNLGTIGLPMTSPRPIGVFRSPGHGTTGGDSL